MSEIKKLIKKIEEFRDARDWMQFHNHKDMAISLSLEAAEVLEHFQWKSSKEIEEYVKNNKEEIGEELADVAIYLFELTNNLKINLGDAVEKKLDKNNRKYPVKKAKGVATKYNKL